MSLLLLLLLLLLFVNLNKTADISIYRTFYFSFFTFISLLTQNNINYALFFITLQMRTVFYGELP
jgi:hypothetical protein